MKVLLSAIVILGCSFVLTQCSKKDCNCTSPEAPAAGSKKLSYGDSVFYLRNTAYSVSPTVQRQGTYTAFPENLQIDKTTGKITVAIDGNDGNSQTGLWYKIKFNGHDGQSDSTMILLSGINYVDRFYQLSQNDSIIYPIYNGNPSNAIPAGNYNLKEHKQFAINPVNGQININECIRRGYFSKELNTSWKKTTIRYAINDKSNRVENQIDIVLYYYYNVQDVPSNISQVMQAHQSLTLGYRTTAIPNTYAPADDNLPSDLTGARAFGRPRPPCIVIIGH